MKGFGVVVFFLALGVSGCAKDQRFVEISQQQSATIQALNQEIVRLNTELENLLHAKDQLSAAKSLLENQLQREIASGDITIRIEARGLVITVLDRMLFDAGKTTLKLPAKQILFKVASVLAEHAATHQVYIEGHTDNQPIRFSKWKSNWELSTARALEVLHFFVEQAHMAPSRIAATGCGQYRPVALNSDELSRMKNRRVEIVVVPVGQGVGIS